MGRRPSPKTVALSDQVIAVLRDAGRPLNTLEVAARVAGSEIGAYPARRIERDVYRVLASLRAKGSATEYRPAGWSACFWSLVEADRSFAEFETALSTSFGPSEDG